MLAGKYSFIIEQGSTLDFEIQYKNPNGVPIDLSGCQGHLMIRSNYSGSGGETYLGISSSINPNITKLPNNSFISFSGSNQQTPPTSGSIGIYVGWELTQAMNFNQEAFYDLEITSGSIRYRLLEGRVKLNKQVTIN